MISTPNVINDQPKEALNQRGPREPAPNRELWYPLVKEKLGATNPPRSGLN